MTECVLCGSTIDRTIPDPIPEDYECMWSEALSGKALYCQACYDGQPIRDAAASDGSQS